MKKLLISIILFASSLAGYSPKSNTLMIVNQNPANPYLKLFKAVSIVESNNDPLAYNSQEEARGIVQIRPVRILDYNRRTGKRYSRKDLFNPQISKEIFMYYAQIFGPYDIEDCAKAWNGSGVMVIAYWHRVKSVINRL